MVTEYTLGNGKTNGTYVVVGIFDETQAAQVTKTFVSDKEVDNVLAVINNL